jgi:asparaginyl-tRNA synthetase
MDIRDLFLGWESKVDQTVSLEGWVRNHRDQKSFGFLMLNDGTDFRTIQVVYDESLANFSEVKKIRVGAAVMLKGMIVQTPSMPQPFEIKATEVTEVGASPEDYPIQPKRHTREFLRTVPHLRLRTNLFTALFKVRSVLHHAIHDFFASQGFVHLAAPIITASDAEGAGELFQVTTLPIETLPKSNKPIDYSDDFFGNKTHLTVSGQLQAEIFAQNFKKVYTFGPTFRAENSNTKTHASEFWMIEPEMAFSNLQDVIKVSKDMVKSLIKTVLEKAPEEMAFFDEFVEKGLIEKLTRVMNSSFVVMTHQEAIEKLIQSQINFEINPEFGKDLATEHEKALVELMKEPVYVVDWPENIKAFYMRLNDDHKTVAAMDLLVPGAGELIGGSQREERIELLEKRMKQFGIDPKSMQWYLDLRKYGSTPHAGFGLGFDRMLIYLTGVENIRDVIPFPRTPKNCQF